MLQATFELCEIKAQPIIKKYALPLRMLQHAAEDFDTAVKTEQRDADKQRVAERYEAEMMKEKKTTDCIQKIRNIKSLLEAGTSDIPAAMALLEEVEEMIV